MSVAKNVSAAIPKLPEQQIEKENVSIGRVVECSPRLATIKLSFHLLMKVLLLRHALNDSIGVRLVGRMEGIPLNREGQLQAQKVAERLSHLQINAIYSSPVQRAIETAEPIANILKLSTVTSDYFTEVDFGEWTNSTFEHLKDLPVFKQFNSFRSFTRTPGGELMLEAQLRIIKGLEELFHKHQSQTIAIVSHADLIKAAIAYYAGIHLDMFHRIEISPASLSVIEIYENTARILRVNYTGEI